MDAAFFAKTFNALWKVLIVGIVFGAGLPALFAFGLSSLYSGQPETAGGNTAVVANPVRRIAGWLAFVVVIVAIVLGILVIVVDKDVFNPSAWPKHVGIGH